MGARITYSNNPIYVENDNIILKYCQSLILYNLPNLKRNTSINSSSINQKLFESLSNEQINTAFENMKKNYQYYLEILQKCDIAYNEPSLLELIDSLIQNKEFYQINGKSFIKRYYSKRIIDNALIKHLNKVMPKELKFLIKDVYFIKYLNVIFLPLEKDRILMSVEKFFELSLYEKNSLSQTFRCLPEQYQLIKFRINNYRVKYGPILQKYKNDPEYQTIEKIQSVQKAIYTMKEKEKAKRKELDGDEFTINRTVDGLDFD